MDIIKSIVPVNNHKIVIELPVDFNFTQVEVIVLPYIEAQNNQQINTTNNWEEIVGIAEFDSDSSTHHDKYISKTT